MEIRIYGCCFYGKNNKLSVEIFKNWTALYNQNSWKKLSDGKWLNIGNGQWAGVDYEQGAFT